jgi:hypothetical protein
VAGVVDIASGANPTLVNSTAVVRVWPTSGADGNGLSQAGRLLHSQSAQTCQLTANARPNFIRNAGMWFAQRQPPGTATTYSNLTGRALSADGWGITNENASMTFQRIDTSGAVETGYQNRYYGQFLKITSNGKFCVSQVIEGVDSMLLRNRVVRLQAMMKGAGGGTPTIKFGLLELQNAGTIDAPPATFISAFGGGATNPTFGTNLAFLTAQASPGDNVSISSNVASAVLTGSWQRFGMAATVSTNAKNLIPVFFVDSQITATQGFSLGQVILCDGPEIQDWSPQPYAQELVRVRRFYQKSFNVDAGPATNAGINTGEVKGVAGKAGAVANAGFVSARFDVPLRTGGGTTLYNPGAANALMRNITGGADLGATAVTHNQNSEITIGATGVAQAVGDLVAIHFTSDAEI